MSPDQGYDCVMTETRVPFGDRGVFPFHRAQLPLEGDGFQWGLPPLSEWFPYTFANFPG